MPQLPPPSLQALGLHMACREMAEGLGGSQVVLHEAMHGGIAGSSSARHSRPSALDRGHVSCCSLLPGSSLISSSSALIPTSGCSLISAPPSVYFAVFAELPAPTLTDL